MLNGTLAPGRPLFGLFLQLPTSRWPSPRCCSCSTCWPGRGGAADIGLDARQPVHDLFRGAVLAAVIGGGGLGLYLVAYHPGVELNVVAEGLPDIWWRIPVLLLSAARTRRWKRSSWSGT